MAKLGENPKKMPLFYFLYQNTHINLKTGGVKNNCSSSGPGIPKERSTLWEGYKNCDCFMARTFLALGEPSIIAYLYNPVIFLQQSRFWRLEHQIVITMRDWSCFPAWSFRAWDFFFYHILRGDRDVKSMFSFSWPKISCQIGVLSGKPYYRLDWIPAQEPKNVVRSGEGTRSKGQYNGWIRTHTIFLLFLSAL